LRRAAIGAAAFVKRITPAPLARLPTRRLSFATAAMLVIGASALVFALVVALSPRPQGVESGNSLEALINRAEAGDAKARSELGFAYIAGKIVPHDTKSAARWALLSAEQGNAGAQYLIASLLSSGDGIAADPRKAFVWFAKSAAQGNIKAMHNLAIAYVQGRGTAKDPAAAADWFARAAAAGYVDSAFDLAVLYEQGLGVKQDPVQALRWYRKAAAAGDHAAASRAHFLETDGHP
jgi:TPR repeat protein